MSKTNEVWIDELLREYTSTGMTRDEFCSIIVKRIKKKERKAERRGRKAFPCCDADGKTPFHVAMEQEADKALMQQEEYIQYLLGELETCRVGKPQPAQRWCSQKARPTAGSRM